MIGTGDSRAPAATTAAGNQPGNQPGYRAHLAEMQRAFDGIVGRGRPVFVTDADPDALWRLYLSSLPWQEQQHHDCRTCRDFVRRYGGLVIIDPDDGSTASLVWAPTGTMYDEAHRALARAVRRSAVTGVHVSSDTVWGTAVTVAHPRSKHPGARWEHVHLVPPAAMVHRDRLKTAGQAMAEKRGDWEVLGRAFVDFSAETVATALTIVEAEALYRGEKVAGPLRWFAELIDDRRGVRSAAARQNLAWLAVAQAPAGFSHVRSSMVGSLLEDVAAGLPLEVVKRRFAEKMSPLQYQRPQAPPAAGNLARAEKVVAELATAGALRRRHARLDDLSPIWRPVAPLHGRGPVVGPVFGHLTPRSAAPPPAVTVPAGAITWRKFLRVVLPDAEAIEALVPNGRVNALAHVTACDPHAPPILQWDPRPDGTRCPVSWYVYQGGRSPGQWCLRPGEWARVTAVALLPFMRDPDHEDSHHGAGAVLVLEGCRDRDADGVLGRMGGGAGLALFPEILKSEYREIRSSIEAFSRAGRLEGAAEASACGLDLRRGQTWNQRVRVTSLGGARRIEYVLDRWD